MDHQGMLNEFRDTRRRLDALEQAVAADRVFSRVHQAEETTMSELCKQAEEGAKQVSIGAMFGAMDREAEERKFEEAFADYAAGVPGPTGREGYGPAIDMTQDEFDAELKDMDDEDIEEMTSLTAEEQAEKFKARRDELNDAEYRNEAHGIAHDAFRYHPATEVTGPKHENVRNVCGLLAHRLIDACPPSSELDTALDRLREVMFWANAAVALG